MKIYKKALTFTGIFACALSLLAGCGKTGTEESVSPSGQKEETKEIVEVLEEVREPEKELTMTPADKETIRKAIVETALAYYRKDPNAQYDSRSMTTENPQPLAGRLTQYAPPEYASADQCYFAQCTQFCLDILHDTCGWRFFDDIKEPHTDPGKQWDTYRGGGLVYKKLYISEEESEEVLKEYLALLQPGDIVVSFGEESGHAMMWLGDCLGDGRNYLLHCWGSSIEYASGYADDAWEKNGALFLQTAEDLILGGAASGMPKWDLHVRSVGYLAIFRFMEDENMPNELTPQALSRLKYPRMTVDSYAEGYNKYLDVPTGSTLKLVTKITNYSDADYENVPVVINLPKAGVEMLPGEQTAFTVNVPKNESVEVSCSVKVTANRGSVISVPHGAVADIPTRELFYKVGGTHFTEDQENVIADWAFKTPKSIQGEELAYVKDLYKKALGLELNLPDTYQELMDLVFAQEKGMLVLKEKDAENSEIYRMAVRQNISGHSVSQGKDVTNRLIEVQADYYKPGDIFVCARGSSLTKVSTENDVYIYIYLGFNTVREIHCGMGATEGFDDTIPSMLGAHSFVVLRPSLAFDDVASVAIPSAQ